MKGLKIEKCIACAHNKTLLIIRPSPKALHLDNTWDERLRSSARKKLTMTSCRCEEQTSRKSSKPGVPMSIVMVIDRPRHNEARNRKIASTMKFTSLPEQQRNRATYLAKESHQNICFIDSTQTSQKKQDT